VVVLERVLERESLYVFALERARQPYVYNLDKTLERITSFAKISGLLFSLLRPDWTLMTSTHRLTRRLGIIVSLLRRRERVREESWNETVVLTLLNVQILYLLRCLTIKECLTILVHFCGTFF